MMKTLKDLAPVKDMLAKAKDILGYDIEALMLNGPEEQLEQTKYCQPAMYISALAAVEQLKIDDPTSASRFQAVAGLSLGEYTALTVAGVFDFETGLKVVKARAEAMDHEVKKPGAKPQGMVSIAGLTEDKVTQLCGEALAGTTGEVCQIANHLFPKGFSVGCTDAVMEALVSKAEAAGALQAKKLKTGGAFHTSLQAGARDALVAELGKVKGQMSPPRCQVYMNRTGKAVGPSTPVEDIIALLGEQLVSPVLWEQCMLQAVEEGCSSFFECGPNKQLKSMMKRISKPAWDRMENVFA